MRKYFLLRIKRGRLRKRKKSVNYEDAPLLLLKRSPLPLRGERRCPVVGGHLSKKGLSTEEKKCAFLWRRVSNLCLGKDKMICSKYIEKEERKSRNSIK